MDWIQGIQQAIDYIEEHITEKINYEEAAKRAYSSSFHFQRVFGIMCGFTVGEYIRRRRLTLAGNELLTKDIKVIDVALKYGYETPESFSRAFQKFHGIAPSQVKTGCNLKSFSRLRVKIELIGGTEMNYRIEEKEELRLVGYKKHFSGVPYGNEREQQGAEFYTTTRAKQWLLTGMSSNYEKEYNIITNIGDDGYDFYIAYEVDEWTTKNMFDSKITGVDFMNEMGFETIVIPRQTYAIFETQKKKNPICDYADIRKKIVTEWLPTQDHVLANGPEVVILHWRIKEKREWAKNRYIEIRLPIEQK
ncbi:MAG: AraC family transcriptional regulator [Clostridia bacterium]|nr:AraC family transcriptional regulator [Clostridia bacterium]